MTTKRKAVVLCMCSILAISSPHHLVAYWIESPAVRLGWLGFAVWGALLLTTLRTGSQPSKSNGLAMGATSLGLFAAWLCTDIQLLRQLAAAAAIVGLINPRRGSWWALITSIAMLPVIDFALPNHALAKLLLVLVIPAVGGILVNASVGRLDSEMGEGKTRETLLRRMVMGLLLGVSLLTALSIYERSSDLSNGSQVTVGPLGIKEKGVDYQATRVALAPSERMAIGSATAERYFVTTGSDRFLLTVIDASADAHAIHHPSLCHAGRGWRTESTRSFGDCQGDCAWLRLRRDQKDKQLLFWFADGQVRHHSFIRFRLEHLIRRFTASTPTIQWYVNVDVLSGHRRPADLIANCSIFDRL